MKTSISAKTAAKIHKVSEMNKQSKDRQAALEDMVEYLFTYHGLTPENATRNMAINRLMESGRWGFDSVKHFCNKYDIK